MPPTAPPAAESATGLRQRDREATAARILDAARELFTRHGYQPVSVRAIAAEAGVSAALINRYFGSKRGLLMEVIALEAPLPRVLDAAPEELPRRLAEYLVDRDAGGPSSPLLRALDRSADDPDLKSIWVERLNSVIIEPLAGRLGGQDPRVRASLTVAVVIGLGTLRRLDVGESLAGAEDRTAVVDRLTRVLETCLAEALPPGPA